MGIASDDASADQRHSPGGASGGPVGPDAAAPSRSSTSISTDRVDAIVREIRDGLALISAREMELRRREQEFGRQYQDLARAARQAAEKDFQLAQQRLAQRVAELNAQMAEIASRRARLGELENELQARAVELERQRADLAIQRQKARQRAEQLRAWEQRQRQVLAQREESLRRQQDELNQRVKEADASLARQREELERRAAELEQQAAALADAQQQLARRQAELEQRLAAERPEPAEQDRGLPARLPDDLERRAAEVEAATRRLEAERRRIANEWNQLEEATYELEAERARLAEGQAQLARTRKELEAERSAVRLKQQEFEQRWQTISQQQQKLARQAQELEACRRLLEQQRADTHERTTHLARREAQLQESLGAVEAERQRLAAWERQLAQRDAALVRSLHLAQRADRQAGAVGPRVAAGGFWAAVRARWLRTTSLAAAIGLLVGWAWLMGHPLRYRAVSRLEIVSVREAPEAAVVRHAGRLVDPGLLDGMTTERELAEQWRKGCQELRVSVRTDFQRSAVWLSLTADDPQLAERVLAAAGQAYAQRLETASGGHEPDAYVDLVARRERLKAEIERLSQQKEAHQTALTDASVSEEHDQAADQVDRLQAELAEVAAAVEQQRATLAALESEPGRPEPLAPAEIEQALARDAIYREDQAELGVVAAEYRAELGAAMLSVTEPASRLQTALAQFAAALAEQQALDPPAAIAGVLEQCGAAVLQAQTQLEGFAQQWRSWLEVLRGASADRDVVALITQQNDVADAARRQAHQMLTLVEQLGERIEALRSEGDGGTRQVVVAAVLGSEYAPLKSAAAAFAGAARKTALSENLELDARDRKLRGLHTRLKSRAEAVIQELQVQVDQAAREHHSQRLQEARQQLDELERRRDELAAGLLAALQTRHQLDQAAGERDELAVRLRQWDAEIAWLQARYAEVDRELAEAVAASPPDHVRISSPVVEPLSPTRYRGAALVGAGAFVATWVISLLLLAPKAVAAGINPPARQA